ncbi:Tubulin polyglutamylase TTLL6 [Tritrichomonas foetus]|uniref:Tubulin polyglutamylase TTLL6 n=1 Tax=Tritrichomonas foetus TaxID=1144522 RepID=A0A1J4KAU0_9EUKA|nr:Tubulin polyglutamylase TTLL6 [Tritrichomonas foetus]|eukprot:OHT08074.1 Tubulin polyglutamylase TTLL6 [Tritrichomonas foetus]
MKQKKPSKPTQKYVWANLTNTHYTSVRQCVEEAGFKITESDTKALLFWYDGGGQMDIASSLEPWQFYNHFPAIWSISRKVELARNIERMARYMPEIYKFHPRTFLLPGQFNDLKGFMLSIPKRKKRTFIIKPDAGAQGKGIILVQNPEQLEDYFEAAVAQQYIKPFLIDGYKFDLRIYALLTSVDPLRIYIHKEGMARFCSEKYVKPRGSNLDQVFSHLTNYSLNKKNDHFQANNDSDSGSKRSLSSVFNEIEKMGHSTKQLQDKIDDIIRLTIASVQPFLANNYHTAISSNDGKSRCFEILGFDIMIDKKLNPWLIEVNCMPSLTCDSKFDSELKLSVISGTLKIIALNPNFKKMVTNRQKAETQKRISGTTNIPIRSLFSPEKESEIAKTTNWRQLYPLYENNIVTSVMDSVLAQAKETPVGAAVETVASRARKEAVLQQIRENEQKAKIEMLKSQSKKRPPFSTDTTTPLSNVQKQPQRKITTNIVQKPTKKVTRVQKLSSQIQRRQVSQEDDSKTAINIFQSEPGIPIIDSEERERIKIMQKQSSQAKSLNIEEKIWLITGKPNPKKPKQSEVVVPSRVKSERRPRQPFIGRQVVKPVLFCMNT